VKVFTAPPLKEYSKDLFQVINLEARKKMESSDSVPSFFASFSHFKNELDGNLMEQVTEVNTASNLHRSQEETTINFISLYYSCISKY
jgi:hypothetical protein